MDIDATVSGPSANSYFTLAEADAAMDGFPNGSKWLNFDELKRSRLLLRATRLVDRFKLWPPKQVKDPEQSLAFPTERDGQGVLPAEVLNAVLETLDFFAAGKMESLKKLQAEGVKSSSMLGQSSSFEADYSELPAGARNELLKRWKIYNGPRLFQKPVERMWQNPTTGSLYESHNDPMLEDGSLGAP